MAISQDSPFSDRDYQAQIQRDIETIQQDLPPLFERDISYGIYTQDICFTDPLNTFKGKLAYRIVYWSLRFHAQLFFTQIHLDLHEVYQADPETIKANWTVQGTLRLPWKPQIFFKGNSTYKLNEAGLIYRHIDTWDRKPIEVLQQFFSKGA